MTVGYLEIGSMKYIRSIKTSGHDRRINPQAAYTYEDLDVGVSRYSEISERGSFVSVSHTKPPSIPRPIALSPVYSPNISFL